MVVINVTKRDTDGASEHRRGRTLQRARLARDAHALGQSTLMRTACFASTPPAWDNMWAPGGRIRTSLLRVDGCRSWSANGWRRAHGRLGSLGRVRGELSVGLVLRGSLGKSGLDR